MANPSTLPPNDDHEPSVGSELRQSTNESMDSTNTDNSMRDESHARPPLQQNSTGFASHVQRLALDEAIAIHELSEGNPRPHQSQITASIKELGQLTPGKIYLNPENGSRTLVFGVTRYYACRSLKIDYLYELFDDLGEYATLEELIIAEYQSSRLSRNLSIPQRVLNAARICKDVFIPMARKNMESGQPLPDTARFRAYERAAQVEGVPGNAVRNGLKILGTPLAELARTGQVKMTLAAKYSHLDDDAKEDIKVAIDKNDIAKIVGLLRGEHAKKDSVGVKIPETLVPFFDDRPFAKHSKALRQAGEWLRNASKAHPTAADCSWSAVLYDYAQQLQDATPYAVCPYCEQEPATKRSECPQCKGRRVLTKKQFDGFKRER